MKILRIFFFLKITPKSVSVPRQTLAQGLVISWFGLNSLESSIFVFDRTGLNLGPHSI